MTSWTGRRVTRAREHWRSVLVRSGGLRCGQGPRCLTPGVLVTAERPWVVEHLVPRALGGPVDDVRNQWVSHRACSDASGGAVRRGSRLAAAAGTGAREERRPRW